MTSWYKRVHMQESPLSHYLFCDTHLAWVWLVVRLYVGWAWLEAGWHKVNDAVWVGDRAGAALGGFVNGALSKMSGPHPDVQSWYGLFLQNVVLPRAELWSYVVAYGELLVGVGLIVGAFTGIAAFFGLFMNLNFLLAGTVSTNPILLMLAAVLMMAWKTAGYIGADRYLLPKLGVPWKLPKR